MINVKISSQRQTQKNQFLECLQPFKNQTVSKLGALEYEMCLTHRALLVSIYLIIWKSLNWKERINLSMKLFKSLLNIITQSGPWVERFYNIESIKNWCPHNLRVNWWRPFWSASKGHECGWDGGNFGGGPVGFTLRLAEHPQVVVFSTERWSRRRSWRQRGGSDQRRCRRAHLAWQIYPRIWKSGEWGFQSAIF